MQRHLAILGYALDDLRQNAAGHCLALIGLFCGLVVLLSGIAVSEGLKDQALSSIGAGPDVFCTWDVFGRDAAIPRTQIAALATIPAVQRSVPRIIGRLQLGNEIVVVVGVPLAELQVDSQVVDGHAPRKAEEVLLGIELARATGLGVGDRVILEGGEVRVFSVSGTTTTNSSLWGSKAIVCDLDEAAAIFGDKDHVSDVCLFTRAGYAERVATDVQELNPRFRVQTRDLVTNYVIKGLSLREGLFSILWLAILALAIPTLALSAYLCYAPRRFEISLLKAEGWRVSDVLQMILWENVVLSALVASLALLSAAAWIKLLRAPLIAPFFIADLPLFPGIEIPTRFLPAPLLLAFVLSLVVTLTGAIYGTWRTAIVPPALALR